MVAIGRSHLGAHREEFQAQVPDWLPLDKDLVVVASGIAEIVLGAGLLVSWKQPVRAVMGATHAAFFVSVFPGNITQFVNRRDAFGLDTDLKRGLRLAFEPVFLVWAIEATDARRILREGRSARHH